MDFLIRAGWIKGEEHALSCLVTLILKWWDELHLCESKQPWFHHLRFHGVREGRDFVYHEVSNWGGGLWLFSLIGDHHDKQGLEGGKML